MVFNKLAVDKPKQSGLALVLNLTQVQKLKGGDFDEIL